MGAFLPFELNPWAVKVGATDAITPAFIDRPAERESRSEHVCGGSIHRSGPDHADSIANRINRTPRPKRNSIDGDWHGLGCRRGRVDRYPHTKSRYVQWL